MFGHFFRFELGYWLRGMMVYVFLAVVAILIGAATYSDNVQVGGSIDNTYRNAPFVIQNFYVMMTTLACLMAVAFVDGAATRDFRYRTHELIFTKPLDKLSYLLGRFWAATLVSIIPMLGVSLGVLLANFNNGIDPDKWTSVHWPSHLCGILLFAVPNAFFIAAIVFAIASLTRSTIASFVGIILLIVGNSVAQNLVGNLDNEVLAYMIDPFGIRAFRQVTRYWTVAEMNTQVVPLVGPLLWNRICWLTVGLVVLAITCWQYSFATRRSRAKAKKAELPVEASTRTEVPKVTRQFGIAAQLRQMWSQLKVDFLETIRSGVFLVLMGSAFLLMIITIATNATEGFGLASLPVTYNMIDTIRGAVYVFLLAAIIFYAGVLVWKERESKLCDVYDALPHATWISYVAKLIALTGIVALVMFLGIIVAITSQWLEGFTRFQIGLYLTEFFILDLTAFFFLIVLALLIHVVSPHKYIAYFVFIIFVIVNAFIWRFFDISTRMVQYGELPGYTYSDLFEFAPFAESLSWFGLYWHLVALLLSIVAILLWRRGHEDSFGLRFGSAMTRWTGWLRWVSVMLLVAWAGVAGWVGYNTMVLNELVSPDEITKLQADYEKSFKEDHESAAQPRVTRVRYDIDIYPEDRRLVMRGDQTIKNKTDESIAQLFIQLDGDYNNELEIEGAELEKEYERFDYRVYRVDPPMEPGDTRQMKYTVSYDPVGFEDSVSNTSIVQNGTFFNNAIAPQIGYQSRAELTDKDDREDHDLGPVTRMPELAPSDLAKRQNTYLSNNSDWVEVETIISTSADQRAIAPGSLLDTWEENGRRYFHYKVDHPSVNFYSFISARYAAQTRQWNGIDIEVYYHKDHEWNVDNMLRSIRSSLEYYTENFGPYRHKQARIIEFPRVASFAQAFPGTMPYSEGIGFIADISSEDDIDMVFYVVAHEMAHQWWAHQVIGANMQGATLLSETLAQYSALMVMEKAYGRDTMRKFLKYEMDRYLRSRGSESLQERPLKTVESTQGYIHYRKGSVVMYYLKEMIGEAKVNAALKKLTEKFAYQAAPYPTSVDLIDLLREQTPEDLQYLLKDLFEDITLFSNRTLASQYEETADGKYRVKLEVECKKFKANGEGGEEKVAINDWIEIGAFAKPEAGKRYGKTLYRKRMKIDRETTDYEFVVDELPHRVGVDPFLLLIDRVPADNMKRPTKMTGSVQGG